MHYFLSIHQDLFTYRSPGLTSPVFPSLVIFIPLDVHDSRTSFHPHTVNSLISFVSLDLTGFHSVFFTFPTMAQPEDRRQDSRHPLGTTQILISSCTGPGLKFFNEIYITVPIYLLPVPTLSILVNPSITTSRPFSDHPTRFYHHRLWYSVTLTPTHSPEKPFTLQVYHTDNPSTSPFHSYGDSKVRITYTYSRTSGTVSNTHPCDPFLVQTSLDLK